MGLRRSFYSQRLLNQIAAGQRFGSNESEKVRLVIVCVYLRLHRVLYWDIILSYKHDEMLKEMR